MNKYFHVFENVEKIESLDGKLSILLGTLYHSGKMFSTRHLKKKRNIIFQLPQQQYAEEACGLLWRLLAERADGNQWAVYDDNNTPLVLTKFKGDITDEISVHTFEFYGDDRIKAGDYKVDSSGNISGSDILITNGDDGLSQLPILDLRNGDWLNIKTKWTTKFVKDIGESVVRRTIEPPQTKSAYAEYLEAMGNPCNEIKLSGEYSTKWAKFKFNEPMIMVPLKTRKVI